MVEAFNGSAPVSPEQLRHVIYDQLGLPDKFRFEFVLFVGGNDDVFMLTSSVTNDGNGRVINRHSHSAHVDRTGQDISAVEFVAIRDNYIEKLGEAFDAHVVDFGIGFPPYSMACVSGADVHRDLQMKNDLCAGRDAAALFRLIRVMAVERLTTWGGDGDNFWPIDRKAVVPFGWAYHECSMTWMPEEHHYSRQVLHVLNTLSWLAHTNAWVPMSQIQRMWLCPGTPK